MLLMQAAITAAPQEMLSVPIRLGEGVFSLAAVLAAVENRDGEHAARVENSRLGLASRNHALHLGFAVCNSRTALGMRDARSRTRVRSRCTGKERDAETGLDYFGARYYANSMGRWMSVDPTLSSATAVDPQTWNRYSYVRNMPIIAIDLDGRRLTLVIVDRSNLPSSVIGTTAFGIAQRYRDAGVKNVNVTFSDSVPFNVRNDYKVDKNTVYLEIQANNNGQVVRALGAEGSNPKGWSDNPGPGGSAGVVDTKDPYLIPAGASPRDMIDALIAYGVHETAHKWLPHCRNCTVSDIMYGGQDPLRNVPFTKEEADRLRHLLATEDEKYDMDPGAGVGINGAGTKKPQ